MSLNKEDKALLIKDNAINSKDTGSPEVQVAILTEKIKYLTDHMKDHPKDLHSRRGLLMMVGRRKSILQYLKQNEQDRYTTLIKKLNLRGVK